ncbi:S-adenosylmethionine decarboxylase proenzyme-like [Uloborus diversus]|uniref:S-adenosylmethionine decarboxylase proenzyme-like n=1 Tax=Uloborus diversus TaxID=327109 RepID=UPI00240A3E12|nr:S-adenosylmethionine decarboxylase proenzyme-like [Uloborus diversus]
MDVKANYCGFFEGTEKLLEVWFGRRNETCGSASCDLRAIPRSKWEKILKLVKCEIISYKKNDHIDAYVLSESSLFVSKNRVILKTCGSTTLLQAVKPLIYIVQDFTDFDIVLDIFYSRKNFIRPELQNKPHTSFEDETEVLDELFDGSAYCLGRMNRDCWYLYTMNPLEDFIGVQVPDQTLEVLMQELDRNVMKIFTREVCSSAKEATQKSGIDRLFPGILIDDYLFEPCGYSMNGLIKGGYYVTIHITPEPQYSYVSFETNYPQESYLDLVAKLLKVFCPGKFIMTLFANKLSVASNGHMLYRGCEFRGFRRKELQFSHFKNYDLAYALFAKAPS